MATTITLQSVHPSPPMLICSSYADVRRRASLGCLCEPAGGPAAQEPRAPALHTGRALSPLDQGQQQTAPRREYVAVRTHEWMSIIQRSMHMNIHTRTLSPNNRSVDEVVFSFSTYSIDPLVRARSSTKVQVSTRPFYLIFYMHASSQNPEAQSTSEAEC